MTQFAWHIGAPWHNFHGNLPSSIFNLDFKAYIYNVGNSWSSNRFLYSKYQCACHIGAPWPNFHKNLPSSIFNLDLVKHLTWYIYKTIMREVHGALVYRCLQSINVFVTSEHYNPIFTNTSSGRLAKQTCINEEK